MSFECGGNAIRCRLPVDLALGGGSGRRRGPPFLPERIGRVHARKQPVAGEDVVVDTGSSPPSDQAFEHEHWERGLAIVCAVIALALSDCVVAAIPAPLACDGARPQPPYGLVGEAPTVQTWDATTLAMSPAGGICSGWSTQPPRLVVAVAGRFRKPDDADGLLTRFGAISELTTVRYWSVTDGAWRPLVTSATALVDSASGQPRDDFSAAELRSGRNVYLRQQDGRSASTSVYRMRV